MHALCRTLIHVVGHGPWTHAEQAHPQSHHCLLSYAIPGLSRRALCIVVSDHIVHQHTLNMYMYVRVHLHVHAHVV